MVVVNHEYSCIQATSSSRAPSTTVAPPVAVAPPHQQDKDSVPYILPMHAACFRGDGHLACPLGQVAGRWPSAKGFNDPAPATPINTWGQVARGGRPKLADL